MEAQTCPWGWWQNFNTKLTLHIWLHNFSMSSIFFPDLYASIIRLWYSMACWCFLTCSAMKSLSLIFFSRNASRSFWRCRRKYSSSSPSPRFPRNESLACRNEVQNKFWLNEIRLLSFNILNNFVLHTEPTRWEWKFLTWAKFKGYSGGEKEFSLQKTWEHVNTSANIIFILFSTVQRLIKITTSSKFQRNLRNQARRRSSSAKRKNANKLFCENFRSLLLVFADAICPHPERASLDDWTLTEIFFSTTRGNCSAKQLC